MCIFCICQKIVLRFESFPPTAPVPEKVHVQRRGPHFTQKTHEHRGHIDEIPTVASFFFQKPAPEPPLKFSGIGSRANGKTFDMRSSKLTRWGSFVRRPSLAFNSQWHWQWRFGAGSWGSSLCRSKPCEFEHNSNLMFKEHDGTIDKKWFGVHLLHREKRIKLKK